MGSGTDMLYYFGQCVIFSYTLSYEFDFSVSPHIVQNEWGNVWNTLARTDAGLNSGIPLLVPVRYFESV